MVGTTLRPQSGIVRYPTEERAREIATAYGISLEDTEKGNVYGIGQEGRTVIEIIQTSDDLQVRLSGKVASYIKMDIRKALGRAICEEVDEEESLF
ncbi:hypothetical protein HOC80_01810 [archaeon]|jgi:hypothetical protein|nr:hypothetical protein [archaeon]MBT4416817.1 hypothetical protein [archaeon]